LRVVEAVLGVVAYLVPVAGMLAAFAAVMAGVFMAVPRAIERLEHRARR
jgi:hypothetical protein